MADEVGIRALKQNASAVVARAVAGESIVITDRGRPVARISPLEESIIDRLVAEGKARRPLRPLSELPEPTGHGNVSEELRRMRDEERY